MRPLQSILIIGLIISFSTFASAQKKIQKKLQTAFIMAEDGATITLPEGKFTLNKPLWLDDKKNITIVGAGMDKTILSFKGQTEGAEGIKVTNASKITLKDFTVEDTKGDAIKTQDVDGIRFLAVKTAWTGKPKKSNGAYGLYPVQCTNVMIDGCEAFGASDAGIYVGQSDKVVVRNCRAIKNVAGIEIENTTNADVYNNYAYQNTGGILVFDLPGLIKKQGGYTRVYNNTIVENNYKNFAPKGNIVATVPPGTGIILLAANDVEIFDNTITENKTFGVAIASYYITETPIKDEAYDPYSYRVSVHDNTFKRKKRMPTLKNDLGKLAFLKFGRNVPQIAIDGIFGEDHVDANGQLKKEYQICVYNNKGDAAFTNIDAGNNFEGLTKDASPFTCQPSPLPAVEMQEEIISEKKK